MPPKSRSRKRTIEDSEEEHEFSEENEDLDDMENVDDSEESENDDEEEEDDDLDDNDQDEDSESSDEEEEEDQKEEEQEEEDSEELEAEDSAGADDDAESSFGSGEESYDRPQRMTARQRGKLEGTSANFNIIDISELDGNRSRKKVLSVEEQRIKRAEMARRRRHQSQSRLEAEKKETLDKLLKKRAKKVRGDEGNGVEKQTKSRLHPQHPALSNWTSTKSGFTYSLIRERAEFEGL